LQRADDRQALTATERVIMKRNVKKVAVGSQNPVKLQAVQRAFRRVFPDSDLQAIAVEVTSGVDDQPRGDPEALSGALNRARAASKEYPTADFCVGIEGAVKDTTVGMEAFAWVAVTSQRLVGKGRTATFYLPERVATSVRTGTELGQAIDALFDTVGSKRREGAIGLLTQGVLGRAELYEQGVLVALLPFLKPSLYPDSVVL
jgi:inosine/xanthosine triphosphatase